MTAKRIYGCMTTANEILKYHLYDSRLFVLFIYFVFTQRIYVIYEWNDIWKIKWPQFEKKSTNLATFAKISFVKYTEYYNTLFTFLS